MKVRELLLKKKCRVVFLTWNDKKGVGLRSLQNLKHFVNRIFKTKIPNLIKAKWKLPKMWICLFL